MKESLSSVRETTKTQTKALITGIGGFVGPYLARNLISHGYQVTGLIQTGVDANPPPALDREEYRPVALIPFDLSEPESISKALDAAQPEVLFHLAGFSSVKGSFDDPALTFQANCRGMENLLEAVRKTAPGCKFIFVGSSEEYGLQICSERHYQWALETFKTVSPSPNRIPELPVCELNHLRPLSPYAVSKVYGDYLTRTYWASYGLNAVVARAFNHEGAGRGYNYVTSSIIRQCIQLRDGLIDSIRIGNVGAFRDWSHVEDIVEGYRLLAEKGAAGEVYVLGSRRMNSVLTYLLLGLCEVGYDIEALETLYGEKRVDAPMNPDPDPLWGLVFDKPCIDGQLLSNGLCYGLADRGLRLHTRQGEVKIVFDPSLFRPTDIPLMISNPAKAEKLGYQIRHSLQDIVRDQVGFSRLGYP